jgi:hypothetical protein
MSSQLLVAPLPFGERGLSGSTNIASFPLDALIEATNVTYESGTIGKEGGAAKYNSTAISGSPSILGGAEWNHDGATQRMVVICDDGKIYKDSGAGTFGTTLKSGLTVTADTVPIFITGGKEAAANDAKLFIITGRNAVQVLAADGVSTSDLSSPPADWSGGNQPICGCLHEGRFWGAGNSNDPHRAYYSTTSDHEDVSGGGTIGVFSGEGQRIVAMVSFKGFVIVFKYPKGVYTIDTTDVSTSNWRVNRLSDKLGAAWVGAVAPVEDDIIFMDIGGDIRTLASTNEFGDVGTTSLSDLASLDNYIQKNVNFGGFKQWRAIYYSHKRETHIALTGTGATVNNRRLTFDLLKNIPRFRTADRDTPVCFFVYTEESIPRLYMGDDSGFVWKLDEETRSMDGSGYKAQFQLPHHDLGFIDPRLATRRKNGHFLELAIEPKGNWDVSADILWDGKTVQTVSFGQGTSGAALGSFVLGTDVLSGGQVLNKKRRIVGSGRRFSVVFKNSGVGQDFSIAKAYLHYKIDGERLS